MSTETETQMETNTEVVSQETPKVEPPKVEQPKHKTAKLLAPQKPKKKAKAKKAKKSAARKAAPAKRAAKAKAAKRAKPTSGQSAPPIESLSFDDLNKKEKQVVGCFGLKGEREVHTIEALAKEAFRSQTSKKANSWVRNCLRRLVRANWVEKVTPGEYRLSEPGRKRLVRADS